MLIGPVLSHLQTGQSPEAHGHPPFLEWGWGVLDFVWAAPELEENPSGQPQNSRNYLSKKYVE